MPELSKGWNKAPAHGLRYKNTNQIGHAVCEIWRTEGRAQKRHVLLGRGLHLDICSVARKNLKYIAM